MSNQNAEVVDRDVRDLELSRGPATTATPVVVLEGRGIQVSFGQIRALADVDIEVRAGEVFGLLGPNGAGKSTLLAVLSGLLPPTAGDVLLAGEAVSSKSPQRRALRGLARTFQQPQLFGSMTIQEHFRLAHRLHHERGRVWGDLFNGAGFRSPSSEENRVVTEILDVLELTHLADRPVDGLSLGASRLVEVGQALATRPKVILLDEPSSGLDSHESKRLVSALTNVAAAQGVALVLVEHDVQMVMEVCDVIQVLEFGKTIAVGTPTEVREDPRVQSAYLGEPEPSEGEPTDMALRPAPALDCDLGAAEVSEASRQALLTVANLSAGYGNALALDQVSFEVAPGSVLALLGANGAGKSTLGRTLAGLLPVRSGSIRLDGADVTGMRAQEIRKKGLAYLPEGRGVFPSLSVTDNLKMAVRTLPRRERQHAADRAFEMFPILQKRRRQMAGQMSGGEQQMLSLARALAVGPQLIVADELSLGLAPKIVDQVYEALRSALDDGITLIIIEQQVHRALEMADHCCILRRGQLVWSGMTDAAGDSVLDHYLGAEREESDK